MTDQEDAKDGPKCRGAAGTPHNIALARAIAEAQLSPLQVCSTSDSVSQMLAHHGAMRFSLLELRLAA